LTADTNTPATPIETDTDLEDLLPAQVAVELRGERFVFQAFPTRHLPMYLRTSRSIAAKAIQLGQELAKASHAAWLHRKREAKELGLDYADAPPAFSPDHIPLDMLFERCAPEYVEWVATATKKPVAWVESLDGDIFMQVVALLQELNDQKYRSSKKRQALQILPV